MPKPLPHPRLLSHDPDGSGELICRILGIEPWHLRLLSKLKGSPLAPHNGDQYYIGRAAVAVYWIRHLREPQQSLAQNMKSCLQVCKKPKDSRYLELQAYVHDVFSEALRELLGPAGDDAWRNIAASTGHDYRRGQPNETLEIELRSAFPKLTDNDIRDLSHPFDEEVHAFPYRARNVCTPGWQRLPDLTYDGITPVYLAAETEKQASMKPPKRNNAKMHKLMYGPVKSNGRRR